MIPRILGLVVLGILLCLPSAVAAGGHYIPQTGDRFHYYETIVLNDGMGNYSSYTENTYLNGTVGVTGVLPNGTESASYQNSWSWTNVSGAHATGGAAGNFTFSAITFYYVNGTDNQTGYTNPSVWFYMNNMLGVGDTFTVLNTPMSVESDNYSYDLPGTGYVATIYAQGSQSYTRDDQYGDFTATYTWKMYFDLHTGYIVGYLYTEHDTDGSGDGFTWTDTLYVTSTTYALTPAQAPAASTPIPWALIIGLVVLLLVILLVVWLAIRARNRPKRLPQHAAAGNIGYGAPPPPPFSPMRGPPPINLTPAGQPVPQVVLRETVKVQCRYCGNLIDVTDKVCPNCGAPLV